MNAAKPAELGQVGVLRGNPLSDAMPKKVRSAANTVELTACAGTDSAFTTVCAGPLSDEAITALAALLLDLAEADLATAPVNNKTSEARP